MMAIGKRPQTNAWRSATFVFIGLFLVVLVAAIVLYFNLEKQMKLVSDLENQREELATNQEWASRINIVGTKSSRETYLGKMVQYLEETVTSVTGGPLEEMSAEAKIEYVNRKINEISATLANRYPEMKTIDVNTIGLLGIMEMLQTKLANTEDTAATLQEQFEQLQNQFNDAMALSSEKEDALLAEKEKLTEKANSIQESYNELKALMEKTTGEQVQDLLTKLEEERNRGEKLNQELLKAQAELEVASERVKSTMEKLREIVGAPDVEVAALKPDGKIMLLDEYAKIVHINLGTEDNIYAGMTFGVYDKNVPIPRDGKGKAEIEVFNLGKTISTARIITTSNNPILIDDPIANLVWDKSKTNSFVVAGDFDLDNDGRTDYEGSKKVNALIEGWGGIVDDSVTVNTDFVVLGTIPKVLPRPTYDTIAVDPLAMDKYEASLNRLENYKEVRQQAQNLDIPIFNYDRFLYLIGYKTQSGTAGAFLK